MSSMGAKARGRKGLKQSRKKLILVCHRIGEWRSTLLPSQFESARRAEARTRNLKTDKNVCPTKDARTRSLRTDKNVCPTRKDRLCSRESRTRALEMKAKIR